MERWKGCFFVGDSRKNTTAVVTSLLDAYRKLGINPQYIPVGDSKQPEGYDSGCIIDCINETQLALVHKPGTIPRSSADDSIIENPRLVEMYAGTRKDAQKVLEHFEKTMHERGFELGMTPEGLMQIEL